MHHIRPPERVASASIRVVSALSNMSRPSSQTCCVCFLDRVASAFLSASYLSSQTRHVRPCRMRQLEPALLNTSHLPPGRIMSTFPNESCLPSRIHCVRLPECIAFALRTCRIRPLKCITFALPNVSCPPSRTCYVYFPVRITSALPSVSYPVS
jgi:hypothetical protein